MSKKFDTTSLFSSIALTMFVGFLLIQTAGSVLGVSHPPQSLAEKVQDAKSLLQQGINDWDLAKMQEARDSLLRLHLQANEKNECLLYFLALTDYRMATYYMTQGAMEETGVHIAQGKKFLEKSIELKPDWGEPYALYATLLGFEIALKPEEAMTIAFEIGDYFGEAYAKDPDNPRTYLLKGTSELFTPESYGGGPDVALNSLETALSCFEKENITDPLQPCWGKDELYTFMGMAYNQKGDAEKAKEYLKKALTINPDLGLAKDELEKLKDK